MTSVLPARPRGSRPTRPRGTRPTRPRGSRLAALVEAMATPHAVDRYLELVDPMVTLRDLRAEVVEVRRGASGSVTLTLRPTRQWAGFTAGQFVQIGVVIDGIRHTRCYSPAGSQHRRDGHIELTVKAHPDGLVSRYLHDNARPGLVIDLAQADGAFRLPDDRPAKVLLISGGSGITPVLSMLRTLLDEGFAGEIAFVHYAACADAVADRAELIAVAAAHPDVALAFGYPTAGGGTLRGRFELDHLESTAPWFRDAETYLCGPAGLMDAVRAAFADSGLTDRLHSEEFVSTITVAGGSADGTVSFTGSGVAVADSGATLLDQAEAAGLSPQSGCRMGICFSCVAVKTTGCTRNVRTGETDSDPDQQIQLCINAAVGDVAIDI